MDSPEDHRPDALGRRGALDANAPETSGFKNSLYPGIDPNSILA